MQVRKHIAFIRGDGIEFIRYNAHRADTAFFIDPPYTLAARRLYTFGEIDHRRLFKVATKITGDFLMTYDDTEEIRELLPPLADPRRDRAGKRFFEQIDLLPRLRHAPLRLAQEHAAQDETEPRFPLLQFAKRAALQTIFELEKIPAQFLAPQSRTPPHKGGEQVGT